MKKKIMIVLGTRSEIIKFSSIIRELKRRKIFDVKILHTGQHETKDLMKLLDLPEPDIYLGESLRKKWARKGKMYSILLAVFWLMKTFLGIRRTIIKEKPDAIFYQGNCMSVPITVFAAKSVSKKIILIHRESGIRTHNIFEPFLGELSEIIGDRFADILFTPSKVAENNLKKEKIRGLIFNVGDPHVEIIDYVLKRLKLAEGYKKEKYIKGYKKEKYIIVNVIRFENINNKNKMKNLVEILIKSPFKVIFPMNPNTKDKLKRFGFWGELEKHPHIVLCDPYNYIDFLYLIKNSEAVLTDSGGVQQEAFILKVPCIFLGKINVWKEFENIGVVRSTEFDVKKTLKLLQEIKNKGYFYKKVKKAKYPLGDGKATKKIVDILEKKLGV
ncbi:MAG: UDP-N-acetylglucosamine 2-epimerase [Candidatus Aenigmatarchaeota archaeon]